MNEAIEGQPTLPTGYRERLQAGIERYRPELREELVAFRRGVLGDACVGDAALVRWMYEESPATSAGGPSLWVYRHAGAIVGQQGALGVRLKVGSRYVDAAWAVNLLVTPEHQLRGIGAVLSERCCDAQTVTLGLEVSDEARRAYLRAGWIDLGPVPLYVRPLDLSRAAEQRWGKKLLTRAGAVADVPLWAVDQAIALRCVGRRVHLEPIACFDERADALWEQAAYHYPVAVRRDRRALDWRFASHPERGRYELYYVRHGREVVGYVVLRLELHASKPAGHIVDFCALPEWSWFVLARAVGRLRSAGATLAYCLHRGPAERVLSQLGFIQRNSGWPLMFRARALPSELVITLCRTENWFITAGDSDVDRPREGVRYPEPIRWRPAVPENRAFA